MTTGMDKQSGAPPGDKALLPSGLRDQLAPFAEFEAETVSKLMAAFARFGYDRVTPPLMEFEETLLSGTGKQNSPKMFRVMDPDTQRVLGLRSDMTVQIARMAATRMQDIARPLRLSYAGNVVRVRGSQVRPTRQFIQAGVEIIGCDSLAAELEVICLAVEALVDAGVVDLTLDLTVAPLAGMVADSLGLDAAQREIAKKALDAKDVGALDVFGGTAKEILTAILLATGIAGAAMEKLEMLSLSGAAGQLVARLGMMVDALSTCLPKVKVTIDPGESHGFEYKSGIGFAVFAPGVRGELGRGGRYMARGNDGGEEPAAGFSIYLDSIIRALPIPSMPMKIFLPFDVSHQMSEKLRKKGYRTVQALTEVVDCRHEAQRLHCSHWFNSDKVEPV